VELTVFQAAAMRQVHVQVILTNHREEVLARLGQFSTDQVQRYETEALIDAGTYHSVLPPADAMIMGAHVLLDVTVLEKLDLVVDTLRGHFMPNAGTIDQPVFRV
jgi:hypothetical protein